MVINLVLPNVEPALLDKFDPLIVIAKSVNACGAIVTILPY